MKPLGNWTSTFVVAALSRSFGTRTTIEVKPPDGSAFGCTVTCANAVPASASAAAVAATERDDSLHRCLLHLIGVVVVRCHSSNSPRRTVTVTRQSPGIARTAPGAM